MGYILKITMVTVEAVSSTFRLYKNMEPKSPKRQSPRRDSPRLSPRQKEGTTSDEVLQRILDLFKQKLPFEKFAISLNDLARKQPEPFQQCFGSKSRVGKLIQSSPS